MRIGIHALNTCNNHMDKITLVITSCGRVDLLKRTLDSFFKFNTHPIERFIITEDSANQAVFDECLKLNSTTYGDKLEFIFNFDKLGQTRSIDRAYATITTPYVFHCEDDWEFYREGFIEKSLMILRENPSVLQAWIRPKSDGHLSPIAKKTFMTSVGIPYRTVHPVSFYTGKILDNGEREVVRDYMGFSFNPGLKRMSDYHVLGERGYHQFGQEHMIDQHYRDLGYRVVSISVDDSDGYVKHIGAMRRVPNTIH